MANSKFRISFLLIAFSLFACKKGEDSAGGAPIIPPPGQLQVPQWVLVTQKENLWALDDVQGLREALKVRLEVTPVLQEAVQRSPDLIFVVGKSVKDLSEKDFTGLSTKTKVFIFVDEPKLQGTNLQLNWVYFDHSFVGRLKQKVGSKMSDLEVRLEWESLLRSISQGNRFEKINFRSGFFRIIDKTKKHQDLIREFSLSELAGGH